MKLIRLRLRLAVVPNLPQTYLPILAVLAAVLLTQEIVAKENLGLPLPLRAQVMMHYQDSRNMMQDKRAPKSRVAVRIVLKRDHHAATVLAEMGPLFVKVLRLSTHHQRTTVQVPLMPHSTR